MFIVTSAIGDVIAKIASGAGITPQDVSVYEDRLVVTFVSGKPQRAATRGSRGDILPTEGWVNENHRWRNGEFLMTTQEIADAIGEGKRTVSQRLYAGGRIRRKTKKAAKLLAAD